MQRRSSPPPSMMDVADSSLCRDGERLTWGKPTMAKCTLRSWPRVKETEQGKRRCSSTSSPSRTSRSFMASSLRSPSGHFSAILPCSSPCMHGCDWGALREGAMAASQMCYITSFCDFGDMFMD